jgi:hypothetical protein
MVAAVRLETPNAADTSLLGARTVTRLTQTNLQKKHKICEGRHESLGVHDRLKHIEWKVLITKTKDAAGGEVQSQWIIAFVHLMNYSKQINRPSHSLMLSLHRLVERERRTSLETFVCIPSAAYLEASAMGLLS